MYHVKSKHCKLMACFCFYIRKNSDQGRSAKNGVLHFCAAPQVTDRLYEALRLQQCLDLLNCSQPLYSSAQGRKSERAGVEVGEASQRIEYCFRSLPPILSSLPFCAGIQFSRDSIRTFNDGIRIRENRGLLTV